MSGLSYICRHTVSSSAAIDLMEFLAPSDAVVEITKLQVSQQDLTSDEFLQIIGQRATASGSGGTAVTPRPTHVGYPAAGTTVEGANVTTPATLGDSPMVDVEWNVRGPEFLWVPTDDKDEIVLSPSGLFVLRLNVAPSGASDFRIIAHINERGG